MSFVISVYRYFPSRGVFRRLLLIFSHIVQLLLVLNFLLYHHCYYICACMLTTGGVHACHIVLIQVKEQSLAVLSSCILGSS